VNGERRLRSWFATMIPGGLGGASRRKTDAQGSILTLCFGQPNKGKRGAKVRQTPWWSAVRRGRAGRFGRLLLARAGIPGALYGALLPQLEGERMKNTALVRADKPKSGLSSRETPTARMMMHVYASGCLTIGSGKRVRCPCGEIHFPLPLWERVATHPLPQGERGRRERRAVYVANRKCNTSPSATTYSLPSRRNFPASFAPASPLNEI
jgi:hypothetical protein